MAKGRKRIALSMNVSKKEVEANKASTYWMKEESTGKKHPMTLEKIVEAFWTMGKIPKEQVILDLLGKTEEHPLRVRVANEVLLFWREMK